MTHADELNETLRRLSQYYGQMPSDDYDFIDAYLRKTEARNISDEGILEIASIHSNYRDGDGERFSHARIIEFARDILSRALPATPVNPPSAERALAAFERVKAFHDYCLEKLGVGNVSDLETIRAALSAPVTDTGWIDEMRRTVSQCPTSDYAKGHADALDAVKQKLDGRG